MRRAGRLLGVVAAALLVWAGAAQAQETGRRELRESQLRLEQIRQEREKLQKEMERLRGRVHDASSELRNLDRQVDASARAMQEIEFQAAMLAASIDSTAAELEATRRELQQRTGLLEQRLRAIYKRGPLHTVRVLFSAESFGDLLSRHRYLYQIALNDRALQRSVAGMEQRLVAQETELRMQSALLDGVRADKEAELRELRRLESRQAGLVRGYKQQERKASDRIRQLASDEARLKGAIAELERKRREAEQKSRAATGRAAPAGTLSTRDQGNLPWPVDGRIVYNFGVQRKPNGVVLRNNGIGIAAAVGTPVRAVEAGRVDLARPFEGYGPTVIVSHGGGYYTLYHYLGSLSVREGQRVEAGQVIGTVGGERTAEGPHIEFRVQVPVNNSLPEPVDPVQWLRSRAGP